MNHYDVPGREKQPIEIMRDGMTDDEFCGYCVGNVIKYVMRYRYKDGARDLNKAKEYIEFLIRAYNDVPILDDDDE